LTTTDTTTSELNFDTRRLSNFIIQFNISLRLVSSYPKNHPIIASSLHKVLHLLELLLEFRSDITVGVARDTLMVEFALLDSKNPVYRSLAKALFDHDIAAITFTRTSSVDDLLRFSEIMAWKREAVRESGGIEKLMNSAGVTTIAVNGIKYDLFSTTEEETIGPVERKGGKQEGSVLWENFVHGLIDGTLDPAGNRTTLADAFDPGMLADMVNELDDRSALKEDDYANVIASFMGRLHHGEFDGNLPTDSLEKLVSFVHKLNPQLRRQFLNGAFTVPESKRHMVEQLLAKFPDDIILDALAEINSRTTYTPPVTISLLQRLSKKETAIRGKKTSSTSVRAAGDEHLGEKLRIIFREDDRDEYVPSDYQQALRAITSMNSLSVPGLEGIEELRHSLLEHNVETHVARVILQIMQAPPDSCLPEPLERNLLDLVNYFLEMGDFAFVADLYTRLRVLAGSRERSAQTAAFTLLEFFAGDFFVGTVLDSLAAWDKSKQPEIRELVCTVGSTFCQPLLNRLAEEQNRSRRRSYLGCLFELGEIAKNAAIERLSDTRWYFVRNLILLLRELDDPSILQHICSLAEHPHPKVRMEVIRSLQHFKHPAADQLLLQDLSSPERDVQLNAVTLAENSRCHEVFRKLLASLTSGRPTGFDLEMKKSIVRTLAKIGNYEALPTLMQYLETRHLLRQAAHTALKTEIIQSLRNYPAASVLLLEKIAGSDNGELARIARESLTNLQGEA
jgi:HEAT repeat protein